METANPMHRLSTVRRQQGVSLQEIAELASTPLDRVILQETETSDLRLSELWAWQDVLGVPVGDLLIDRGGPLHGLEVEPSQINRLMETASHIYDRAPTLSVERLAKMLIVQLIELMPEENP